MHRTRKARRISGVRHSGAPGGEGDTRPEDRDDSFDSRCWVRRPAAALVGSRSGTADETQLGRGLLDSRGDLRAEAAVRRNTGGDNQVDSGRQPAALSRVRAEIGLVGSRAQRTPRVGSSSRGMAAVSGEMNGAPYVISPLFAGV